MSQIDSTDSNDRHWYDMGDIEERAKKFIFDYKWIFSELAKK